MVGLASTSAWTPAWTRTVAPRATATVLAAACTVAATSGWAGSGTASVSSLPAVAQHLAGQLVQVGHLGQEQLQHGGGVEALVAEQGDRLAGDPDGRHAPAQLVGEHGDVIRRTVPPRRLPASRPTR